MRKKLVYVAAGLGLVAVLVYGWWFYPRGPSLPSPEELARRALAAPTELQQEQAALQLAQWGEPARPHLRRVLQESQVAVVRAACVHGLGTLLDYDSMDLLLAHLQDESLVVRERTQQAVTRMLGRDHRFRADDPPEKRAAAAKKMADDWAQLKDSPLLEYFKSELAKKEKLR